MSYIYFEKGSGRQIQDRVKSENDQTQLGFNPFKIQCVQ